MKMYPDLIAWWGAITGSFALFWDIFKWKYSGPRIRVEANANMQVLDTRLREPKYIYVSASNIGDRSTTITQLVGFHYLSRIKRIINKPAGTFVVPTPISGNSLPYLLNVGEKWAGMLNQDDDIEKILKEGYLYIGIIASSFKKPIICPVRHKKKEQVIKSDKKD